MTYRVALKLQKRLTQQDKCYNTLNNHAVRDKNYENVFNYWKTFKMKTKKDYHDLYVKGDVLFSVQVFEPFRRNIIISFKLDHVYYLSNPAYDWNAMLMFINDKSKSQMFKSINSYKA